MIIKAILYRRSIRAYKQDPVLDKDILEIIKAAEFAPSGRHIHPLEYVIINNHQTKIKLFEILGDEFIKQAPVLIIPIADNKKSSLIIQDISIASGHIFLQAAALGLGTVWKNLNEQDAKKVKSLLGIPSDYTVINIIPIGYAAEHQPPHDDNQFDIKKMHREKF